MVNEQNQIPNITDKRVAPPGILPRNIQAWVLGCVALLMVLIIWLSGHSNPKPRSTTAPGAESPIFQPNEDKLKEYQKRIDEQARKLAIEQIELGQTKKALVTPGNKFAIPTSAASPGSYSYNSPPANGQPSPEVRVKSKIEEEKELREYQSLFASNRVPQERPDSKPSSPDPATAAPPVVSPFDPRLFAWPPIPPQAEPAKVDGGIAESKPVTTLKQAPKSQQPELNRATGKGYRLYEGTIIETVLTNRLDGTFSGPVNCMVSYDVYSHDRNHVLIPSGSRVLGDVHQVENSGQQRLAVSFHRLIMPDGYSFNLDQFHGLDQVGETGLRDQVNHHYLQVFGASIAIGMIAGLAQANTSYGGQVSASDAYRQGVSNSLTQSSMHVLDKFLNILPTFTIREGQRIKIYLSEDVTLPAYGNHEMPDDL